MSEDGTAQSGAVLVLRGDLGEAVAIASLRSWSTSVAQGGSEVWA